ncbi:MAG: hypothetical protein R3E68_09440 [Burkholderiaceae bacterium]
MTGIAGSLTSGQGSSDSTPQIVGRVASGDATDRLEFLANGAVIGDQATVAAGGGNREATLTHNTGLNLNGQTAPLSHSLQQFTVRAVDGAGNTSAASAAFSVDFGFFDCETLRARMLPSHSTPGATCTNCHADQTGGGVNRLLVPPGGSYWCTRVAGDRVLPR